MYDLAMDFRTRDLLISAHNDLAGRSGLNVIYQRIHIRLVVQTDSWRLNRDLGSRLTNLLRVGEDTAIGSIEAAVLDALSDMTDIDVRQVVVGKNPNDSRSIQADIHFITVPAPGVVVTTEDTVLSFLLPIATI